MVDLVKGERWEIWITGDPSRYEAQVEQADPPRLKLLGVGAERPRILKDGDFILLRRLK
jgi:hypothetical protein